MVDETWLRQITMLREQLDDLERRIAIMERQVREHDSTASVYDELRDNRDEG